MKSIPLVTASIGSRVRTGKRSSHSTRNIRLIGDDPGAPDVGELPLDEADRAAPSPQGPEDRRPAAQADSEDEDIRPARRDTPRR